jgi:serine/threonine protein kinase
VIDRRRISKEREHLSLLKQEMDIHQHLDHPNIIKCHQIIERPTHYYFILEYCPQGTLESFIKKHDKLSESAVVAIMEQIIEGYKYLMERKILHRDLKPPNILKSGSIWKICDFGFSVQGKKNLVGEINVGTPAYMAPEALERTFYSSKTDFFSLGVICY